MIRGQQRLTILIVCLAAAGGRAAACPASDGAIRPIGAVQRGVRALTGQRVEVTICGQVTVRPGDLPDDPGNFYIQDATGGISVVAASPPRFGYGEWVKTSGRVQIQTTGEPEVTATTAVYAGPGRMPPPRKVSPSEVSEGKVDGWHVAMTGKVVQLSTNTVRDDIVISDGAGQAEAYSRRRRGVPSPITELTQIGASVEIRGVVMPTSSGSLSRVRIRNPQDVLLIKSAPLLESRKGRMGVLIGALLVLAALAWIMALRRAVRRQTAEIRELLDVAEEASRLKSEFVANMSHEIRTPLHAVIGLQQMALEEDSAERRRQYLKLAHDASGHLLELLNNVLDLAAIDKETITAAREPMVPEKVVRDAVSMFAAVASAKGLKLEWSGEGLPPEVCGDPLRLKQVLVNLLSNAVKFTPHGSIRVSSRAEPVEAGWRLHFEVTDTGIGIAGEHRKSVFEEFRQADGSVRRNYGGSGLGLALASRLARLMGGEIEMESQLGTGSTFRVNVVCGKLCAVESQNGDAGPQAGRDEAAGLNLLLVEDNRLNQVVVTRLLENEGHKVEIAENGLRALSAVARSQYDAILMDVQMPEMDGLSAAREIRAREGDRSRTPILAVTAHTSEVDRKACATAGMDGLLPKPFTPDQLRQALARVIPPPGPGTVRARQD